MIIVPTYEPNQELPLLLQSIHNKLQINKKNILIIDDGSKLRKSKEILDNLEKNGFLIQKNITNFGKGYSIKRGLNICLKNNSEYAVIIDSDGQHLVEDLIKIIALGTKKNKFILGVRNFENYRIINYLSNKIINIFIKIICNYNLKDSQCGLRYIPRNNFKMLLEIKENRFDYELVSLLKIIKYSKFLELNIKSIYSKENYISHFKKLSDSFRIILVLFKRN